jgi:hypothetical protein
MVVIGKGGQILRVHRGYFEEGVDDVVKDLNEALLRNEAGNSANLRRRRGLVRSETPSHDLR